jgi:hypothetical protein
MEESREGRIKGAKERGRERMGKFQKISKKAVFKTKVKSDIIPHGQKNRPRFLKEGDRQEEGKARGC